MMVVSGFPKNTGHGGEQRIGYRVMSMWKPIETAPKDGTACLIYTEMGEMYLAYWDVWPMVSGWVIGYDQTPDNRIRPTHWMPLPKPPTTQQKDE